MPMDLDEARTLMGRARESLSSLEADLAEFAKENRSLFEGATSRDDSAGTPHEWHECYERYLSGVLNSLTSRIERRSTGTANDTTTASRTF